MFTPTPFPAVTWAARDRWLRVGVIYFIVAVATWYASGVLDRLGGFSLWYLAGGLRFAVILVLGWMGLLLDAVAIAAMSLAQAVLGGLPLPGVLSVTNLFALLSPLLGYAVVVLPLRAWMGSQWDFSQARYIAVFVIAGGLSALLAASIGTYRQVYFGVIPPEMMTNVLVGWMTGDFVGVVTFAPLLLVMVRPHVARYLRGETSPQKAATDDWIETAWAWPLLLSMASLLLMFAVPWYLHLGLNFPMLALFLLLPLGAIALWFGLHAALVSALVLDTGLVILIALTQQGDLALQYQMVMIAISLVGLALGAAVQARNQTIARYQDFALVSSDLLWEINAQGKLIELTGVLAKQVTGALNQPWQTLLAVCEQPNLATLTQALAQQQSFSQLELAFRGKDQAERWVRLNGQPVYSESGEYLGFRGTAVDIHAAREAQALVRNYNQELLAQVAQRTRELSQSHAALATKEQHLRLLLTTAPVGVLALDARDCCTYLNANASALTGLSEQQARGMPLVDFVHADDGQRVILAWRASRASQEVQTLEFRLRSTKVWCAASWTRLAPVDGAELGSILVLTDSTARHQYEEKLWALAHHDPLTGLPNRSLFHDRCAQALNQARRRDMGLALLWLDLDGFKKINDDLGHEAGDALLAQVAQRLRSRTRDSDTLARMGGDEFAVVLPDITGENQAVALANELVLQLSQPFTLPQGVAHISGSVGVALYPQDAQSVEDLIHYADLAMYCAKHQGRGQVRVWARDCSEMTTIPADL
ncbi:MAG: diguanylate cyclase [Rhodoferax sp.]|jgi:diguanylate cyclase (GGDEF)-like protein/PAS domain S-box-containing protein|nr:diguanylate cyclase [Rhodoferax sp.]